MNDAKLKIKRLEFSIDIEANKASVWEAIWEDKNYRTWSSVFFEGSFYLTDSLYEGGRIMFLAPDSTGIYSDIEVYIPNEKVRFKHLGNVIAAKELAIDEETRKWSGTKESYSLIEKDNTTTLLVEIDVFEEHADFMSSKFGEALEKIKENSMQL